MPEVTRLHDSCTGHGCFPARLSVQVSPNVFINNIAAHRQGDKWQSHGCATCKSHAGVLAKGSRSVYVNGKQIGRIGDPISCGSRVAKGSANVFAGG